MIRLLLWLLGGALLGGIVHLATVLLLPRMATQDAYSRLSPLARVNAISPIPAPTPENAAMPPFDLERTRETKASAAQIGWRCCFSINSIS